MRTLLLITLALAASLAAQAQESPGDPGDKTQEAAAAQGLALMRALAADQSRELGMSSDDAQRATLGTPLPVMSVNLAALGKFKAGDDAAALLKGSNAAFYPVLLNGDARASVRVENAGAGWEMARVGNAGLAAAVERARRSLPSPDAPTVTLVQVLALNLVFVGQPDASGWQLSPVADDASVDLHAGKTEPAAKVFERLAPIAARHTDEPT